MRALLEERGQKGGALQILVPVGLEHDEAHQLGNRVSAMIVRLPLDVDDLRVLVARASSAVRSSLGHHQSRAAHLLASALDVAPEPVIEAAGRIVQHQPFVNLVVTNVPGPSVPLFAMGARMLEAIPVVPIAGNLSVGVAAFSYEGQLTVGILADRDQCPDLSTLAAGVADTFARLTPG